MNGTAVEDPTTLFKLTKSSDIDQYEDLSQHRLLDNFLDFPLKRKYVVIDGRLYLVSEEIPPELKSNI